MRRAHPDMIQSVPNVLTAQTSRVNARHPRLDQSGDQAVKPGRQEVGPAADSACHETYRSEGYPIPVLRPSRLVTRFGDETAPHTCRGQSTLRASRDHLRLPASYHTTNHTAPQTVLTMLLTRTTQTTRYPIGETLTPGLPRYARPIVRCSSQRPPSTSRR